MSQDIYDQKNKTIYPSEYVSALSRDDLFDTYFPSTDYHPKDPKIKVKPDIFLGDGASSKKTLFQCLSQGLCPAYARLTNLWITTTFFFSIFLDRIIQQGIRFY